MHRTMHFVARFPPPLILKLASSLQLFLPWIRAQICVATFHPLLHEIGQYLTHEIVLFASGFKPNCCIFLKNAVRRPLKWLLEMQYRTCFEKDNFEKILEHCVTILKHLLCVNKNFVIWILWILRSEYSAILIGFCPTFIFYCSDFCLCRFFTLLRLLFWPLPHFPSSFELLQDYLVRILKMCLLLKFKNIKMTRNVLLQTDKKLLNIYMP